MKRQPLPCQTVEHPAVLFYGSGHETEAQRDAREAVARTFCSACPVMVACRDRARENREYGVWGGESEEDRARLGIFPAVSDRRYHRYPTREAV